MKNKLIYLAAVGFAAYLALLFDMEATRFLLYFLIFLPVVLELWLFYIYRKVEFNFSCQEGTITRLEEIPLSITLINKSFLPVTRVGCDLWMESLGKKHREKERMETVIDGRSGTVVIGDRRALHCGVLRWQMEGVRIYDYLGIFSRRKREHAAWEIQVLPRLFRLPLDVSRIQVPQDMEAVEYDAHRPGDDVSEIYQIREYRGGDSLSRIHWKMTAKEDQLMVKDYGYPLGKAFLLFLDFSSAEGAGDMDDFLELAGSLCFSLWEEGCIFEAAWYEEERGLGRICIQGEEELYELLAALIRVSSQGEKVDFESLYDQRCPGQRAAAVFCLNRELQLYRNGRLHTDFSQTTWEERERHQVRL